MQNKILLICSIIAIISITGCNSTTITYTEEENENIKMYVQYTNVYIETDAKEKQLSPRKIQPYRSRYRLIKSILK